MTEKDVQACLQKAFSVIIHAAKSPQSQPGALKGRQTAQLYGLRAVALNSYLL